MRLTVGTLETSLRYQTLAIASPFHIAHGLHLEQLKDFLISLLLTVLNLPHFHKIKFSLSPLLYLKSNIFGARCQEVGKEISRIILPVCNYISYLKLSIQSGFSLTSPLREITREEGAHRYKNECA